MAETISMRREMRCWGPGSWALAEGAGAEETVAGSCRTDASVADAVGKAEGLRRVEGASARLKVFKVEGVEMRGSGESGEESVSGGITTPEEVILIMEVETNSEGVLRVGVTAEGSTVAAEAVKVGSECLLRAKRVDPTKMRRTRLVATVHMSLCSRGLLHQEARAR